MTKLTWDNAALISPATAGGLGVENETLVRLTLGGRELEMPVYILPGQAAGHRRGGAGLRPHGRRPRSAAMLPRASRRSASTSIRLRTTGGDGRSPRGACDRADRRRSIRLGHDPGSSRHRHGGR